MRYALCALRHRMHDDHRLLNSAEDCALRASTADATLILRRSVSAGLLTLLLSAVGTHVEPKPGVHRNVGEPGPDISCERGATAMRISTWNFRRTDKMAADEVLAEETLENMRAFRPQNL